MTGGVKLQVSAIDSLWTNRNHAARCILRFSIARNVDSDCVHVQLELRKDDVADLIRNGALTIDVPDVDWGEVKMIVSVQVNELLPRR